MSFENILRQLVLLSQVNNPRLQWQNIISASLQNHKRSINLFLLGKTGHGKSATGNSTLGRKEFESAASMTSVTSAVKCGQIELEDYLVTVIDSPGLADTSFNEDKVQELEEAIENMEKAVRMCPPGIHAFLFVLKFGNRFTNEEQTTLHSLRHIFGHNFLKERGIIIFTHGDCFELAMEEEGTPEKGFHDWCLEQRGALRDLMLECKHRCVLFNNRQKDGKQKQKQMKNVIDFAVKFGVPYSFYDFCSFEHLRGKLILEKKAPLLKEQFRRKIDKLVTEIERVCRPGRTSSFEFYHLEEQVSLLKGEIQIADKSTDLLKDITEELELARRQIDHYKQRQAEAQRLREESESSCCIL